MMHFDTVLCKVFNEHQIPLMHRTHVEERESAHQTRKKAAHKKPSKKIIR